ncbi:AsmA family protein [Cyclobacterium xiamenense]|uniref:AsmA-like C-terminal region-containing protein n=1 Tax=Cyclobacterium xiamenense TaxID=1297121 RepID=UPI0012B7CD29|nr:AsmA-like C-terminal region-containing protein [Cyclobacterium xiamenense]
MKKLVFAFLTVVAILLLVLAVVPFFFKDKIFDMLDREFAASVNAQVYYDRNEVGLTVFQNFPYLTASMGDFGVKGNPPFQNDTLIHVSSLHVDVDVWSVLFEENPRLKGMHLEDGQLTIRVLEDGQANYLIAMEEDAVEQPAPAASFFQMGIDLIDVKNVDLIYDDRSLDYLMALSGIDLQGSGDLTLDVYDLQLKGTMDVVNVTYEGVEYLSDKFLTLDSKINVDLENMRFSAENALLKLNEFGFGIDGFLAMPEESIEMDMVFSGQNNDFKSILSLVPGIYSDSFSALTSSGSMDFKGAVRGVYSETSFPGFDFALTVNDGMFQYPDLPRPVQHVNLDLKVANATGDLDRTSVDLSRFSLEFGNQPVVGHFQLKDLLRYEMDAGLKGNLDLAELTSIFPMEGLELRGKLFLDVKAAGRYDSIAGEIPQLAADFTFEEGYVKSDNYPAPIEGIHFRANAENTSGRMRDLLVNVSTFGFELEGESVSGRLMLEDLEAMRYDFSLRGAADLAKLASVFPLENTLLEGKVRAAIDAKGSYEAIEANRFAALETSGELQVLDFYYADETYPQGIRINEALGDFSPESIRLTKFDARFGESPLEATGALANYMGYLFGAAGQALRGNLDLYSSSFNVNEWMTASENTEEDSSSLQVVPLPTDVDFTMRVKADRIRYDNLSLTDASGALRLADGVLRLDGFTTRALGGSLAFDGTYDPRDLIHPSFAMELDIGGMGIQEAFQSFTTIKTFAPIAQHVAGTFATKFAFSGLLGQDMLPVLSSLDGNGQIAVSETAVNESPLIKGIANLTPLKDAAALRLKPLDIRVDINDGMLQVAPFELQLWNYAANVQGSTGFDGRMNYLVTVAVPADTFGPQVTGLVGGLVGTDLSGTTIPLAITLGGTYGRPEISLASSESLESYVSNAIKQQLSGGKATAKENIAAEFKAREDSLRQEVKEKAAVARDSVEQEASRLVEETKEKAANEVKNLLRGFTNRKKTTGEENPDPE